MALRGAAFAVWAGFVIFCAGLSVSAGLCCADDGHRAVVAKNVVLGLGYATALPEAIDGTNSAPVRFDPGINTGPPFILPCAALLKLFGIRDTIPGLTSVALWASAFTLLLVRVSRRVDGAGLLMGTSVFCFSVLAVSPFHFEHWYAYLGEIFAAALWVCAQWALAME
jgi:hypothetical protein